MQFKNTDCNLTWTLKIYEYISKLTVIAENYVHSNMQLKVLTFYFHNTLSFWGLRLCLLETFRKLDDHRIAFNFYKLLSNASFIRPAFYTIMYFRMLTLSTPLLLWTFFHIGLLSKTTICAFCLYNYIWMHLSSSLTDKSF